MIYKIKLLSTIGIENNIRKELIRDPFNSPDIIFLMFKNVIRAQFCHESLLLIKHENKGRNANPKIYRMSLIILIMYFQ